MSLFDELEKLKRYKTKIGNLNCDYTTDGKIILSQDDDIRHNMLSARVVISQDQFTDLYTWMKKVMEEE